MSECILVADDDREIVKAIAILLEREGYKVLPAYDGLEALDLLAQNRIQLILMDVMMPRMDGLSAIMKIRERRNIPIIVLSAKSEDTDKVLGHLRRYTRLGDINAVSASKEFKSGRLSYHAEERVLYADGESVRLTATETKIVDLFMRNLGRVFSAEEIYRRVWEEDAFAPENTVMVHIRRISEKIELNPKEPEYLKVVWGIGYKIEKM